MPPRMAPTSEQSHLAGLGAFRTSALTTQHWTMECWYPHRHLYPTAHDPLSAPGTTLVLVHPAWPQHHHTGLEPCPVHPRAHSASTAQGCYWWVRLWPWSW